MNIADSSLHVLLVDDDEIDIKNIKYGFKAHKIKNTLDIAKTSADAWSFLHYKDTAPNEAQRPKLILLDINLPKINGLELLKKLRADPMLKSIPVIMVTNSDSASDKQTAEDLDAAGYFIKPIIFEQFMVLYKKLIRTIRSSPYKPLGSVDNG